MSVSVMHFLPELKAFLKERGGIYTVRKFNMASRDIEIEGLDGLYRRDRIGRIETTEDIKQFTSLSGFVSVEDWWKKIRHFIPNPNSPMYLYYVYKKEEEE